MAKAIRYSMAEKPEDIISRLKPLYENKGKVKGFMEAWPTCYKDHKIFKIEIKLTEVK